MGDLFMCVLSFELKKYRVRWICKKLVDQTCILSTLFDL